MSTNEAAERLLTETWAPHTGEVQGLVREALAAERRATVERIRERFNDLRAMGWTAGGLGIGMNEILDEEAAR